MTMLDLTCNRLLAEGAAALAPAIRGLVQLQQLGLGMNELGARGVAALAPALMALTSLQRLDLHAHLTGDGGLGFQRRWLQQQFVGPVEPVLLAAQSWSMKAVSTPLFPYSLWILAGLYGESVPATGSAEVATRESLRAYGVEISRALLNYALAPSYLKALALYAYEILMDGKSLPYRFAQFPVAESPGLGLAPKPTQ